MPFTKRNKRINKLKPIAANETEAVDIRLDALLKLSKENPGEPLRIFIRKQVKQIRKANPDDSSLVVDTQQILENLTVARLRKERKLEVKRHVAAIEAAGPPKPPGPAYEGFQWFYKIKEGRVVWLMTNEG
jgi:hypothetical protein